MYCKVTQGDSTPLCVPVRVQRYGTVLCLLISPGGWPFVDDIHGGIYIVPCQGRFPGGPYRPPLQLLRVDPSLLLFRIYRPSSVFAKLNHVRIDASDLDLGPASRFQGPKAAEFFTEYVRTAYSVLARLIAKSHPT